MITQRATRARAILVMILQGISMDRSGLMLADGSGRRGRSGMRVTGASGRLMVGCSFAVRRRSLASFSTESMRASGSGVVAFLIRVSRTRGVLRMEEGAGGVSPCGAVPVRSR